MAPFHSPALIIILLSISSLLVNTHLSCKFGSKSTNRRLEFNISIKRNCTGHWITNFTIANDLLHPLNNLRARVVHDEACSEGFQRHQIQGIVIEPPSAPPDYTLYPGVGYYKLHPKVAGFDIAEETCIKEGARLAIVNSRAEYDVIRSLVKEGSAYLGFHDRVQEGEFVTVLDQPLNQTGFVKWLPHEPNNGGGIEHCGTYYALKQGGFNDRPCNMEYPFICEFEMACV